MISHTKRAAKTQSWEMYIRLAEKDLISDVGNCQ